MTRTNSLLSMLLPSPLKKTLLLSVLLLLTSCTIGKKDPVNFLSLHRFSAVAVDSPLYKRMKLVDGRDVQVARASLITNKNFIDAEAYKQADGNYGLRIALDAFGKRVWRQASTQQAGERVALMADGKFQSICRFKPFYDHRSQVVQILLYSDLTYSQAKELSDTVQSNYDIIND